MIPTSHVNILEWNNFVHDESAKYPLASIPYLQVTWRRDNVCSSNSVFVRQGRRLSSEPSRWPKRVHHDAKSQPASPLDRPHTRLFCDSVFVEYPRYLRHPLLPPNTPKLPFRRQLPGLIQGARHHIPPILCRRRSIFQYAAPAGFAELAVQERTAAVVGFVDGGFVWGGVGKG